MKIERTELAQQEFDAKAWRAKAQSLEVHLQFDEEAPSGVVYGINPKHMIQVPPAELNPIAEFAAEVEQAARIGRMKISLDQRGTPYTETDEYIQFGGYRMYKHGNGSITEVAG